jgi:plasmid maintenance system antidote protein VapI
MSRMARPRGHRLNPDAFEALLRCEGITITDLALRSEINRATISGLLGGHARASIPQTHKIASVFGCKPAALFPTLRANFVEVDEQAAA